MVVLCRVKELLLTVILVLICLALGAITAQADESRSPILSYYFKSDTGLPVYVSAKVSGEKWLQFIQRVPQLQKQLANFPNTSSPNTSSPNTSSPNTKTEDKVLAIRQGEPSFKTLHIRYSSLIGFLFPDSSCFFLAGKEISFLPYNIRRWRLESLTGDINRYCSYFKSSTGSYPFAPSKEYVQQNIQVFPDNLLLLEIPRKLINTSKESFGVGLVTGRNKHSFMSNGGGGGGEDDVHFDFKPFMRGTSNLFEIEILSRLTNFIHPNRDKTELVQGADQKQGVTVIITMASGEQQQRFISQKEIEPLLKAATDFDGAETLLHYFHSSNIQISVGPTEDCSYLCQRQQVVIAFNRLAREVFHQSAIINPVMKRIHDSVPGIVTLGHGQSKGGTDSSSQQSDSSQDNNSKSEDSSSASQSGSLHLATSKHGKDGGDGKEWLPSSKKLKSQCEASEIQETSGSTTEVELAETDSIDTPEGAISANQESVRQSIRFSAMPASLSSGDWELPESINMQEGDVLFARSIILELLDPETEKGYYRSQAETDYLLQSGKTPKPTTYLPPNTPVQIHKSNAHLILLLKVNRPERRTIGAFKSDSNSDAHSDFNQLQIKRHSGIQSFNDKLSEDYWRNFELFKPASWGHINSQGGYTSGKTKKSNNEEVPYYPNEVILSYYTKDEIAGIIVPFDASLLGAKEVSNQLPPLVEQLKFKNRLEHSVGIKELPVLFYDERLGRFRHDFILSQWLLSRNQGKEDFFENYKTANEEVANYGQHLISPMLYTIPPSRWLGSVQEVADSVSIKVTDKELESFDQLMDGLEERKAQVISSEFFAQFGGLKGSPVLLMSTIKNTIKKAGDNQGASLAEKGSSHKLFRVAEAFDLCEGEDFLSFKDAWELAENRRDLAFFLMGDQSAKQFTLNTELFRNNPLFAVAMLHRGAGISIDGNMIDESLGYSMKWCIFVLQSTLTDEDFEHCQRDIITPLFKYWVSKNKIGLRGNQRAWLTSLHKHIILILKANGQPLPSDLQDIADTYLRHQLNSAETLKSPQEFVTTKARLILVIQFSLLMSSFQFLSDEISESFSFVEKWFQFIDSPGFDQLRGLLIRDTIGNVWMGWYITQAINKYPQSGTLMKTAFLTVKAKQGLIRLAIARVYLYRYSIDMNCWETIERPADQSPMASPPFLGSVSPDVAECSALQECFRIPSLRIRKDSPNERQVQEVITHYYRSIHPIQIQKIMSGQMDSEILRHYHADDHIARTVFLLEAVIELHKRYNEKYQKLFSDHPQLSTLLPIAMAYHDIVAEILPKEDEEKVASERFQDDMILSGFDAEEVALVTDALKNKNVNTMKEISDSFVADDHVSVDMRLTRRLLRLPDSLDIVRVRVFNKEGLQYHRDNILDENLYDIRQMDLDPELVSNEFFLSDWQQLMESTALLAALTGAPSPAYLDDEAIQQWFAAHALQLPDNKLSLHRRQYIARHHNALGFIRETQNDLVRLYISKQAGREVINLFQLRQIKLPDDWTALDSLLYEKGVAAQEKLQPVIQHWAQTEFTHPTGTLTQDLLESEAVRALIAPFLNVEQSSLQRGYDNQGKVHYEKIWTTSPRKTENSVQ